MTNRTPFLTIRAEGALLPVDLLQRVVEGRDLDGLSPESYHLSGEKLNEAINRSWNRLLGAWAAFSAGRERLPEGDAGTSLTREKWLLPLFDELDYGRLQITKAIEMEGKAYAISHGWGEVPIHLVGCGAELDKRMAGVTGAAKASPHSLVQELLNRSAERLWGFVSNGLRMRLLRDNASLTRQAYLEFDLEAMMNGEVYADFVVLWLTCHQSRLESREQRLENCWLEVWSKSAQERGTRALEGLRDGVQRAIEALGKGFLAHPNNGQMRAALSAGAVSTLDLYRQLLRLVYRLIFLFAAEDRQLLQSPSAEAVRGLLFDCPFAQDGGEGARESSCGFVCGVEIGDGKIGGGWRARVGSARAGGLPVFAQGGERAGRLRNREWVYAGGGAFAGVHSGGEGAPRGGL